MELGGLPAFLMCPSEPGLCTGEVFRRVLSFVNCLCYVSFTVSQGMPVSALLSHYINGEESPFPKARASTTEASALWIRGKIGQRGELSQPWIHNSFFVEASRG